VEELLKYYITKNKLHFPVELEKKFNDDYFIRILPVVRIALVLAFILYAVFGILDVFVSPETNHFTWMIRYVIVCPVILAVLIISYFKIFKKKMEILLSIVSISAGFGIIAMIVTARSIEGNLYYYAGLTLIIMWSYTFVRLKFINATVVSLIIIFAYEISIIYFGGILSSRPLIIAFVSNNFFFISSNIIGMFVCYNMEIYTRRDFLQRLLILEHEKIIEEEKNKLTLLSITDPLTKAYNRRYFIDALNSEISRMERYNGVFTIIMFDIDHFKEVNDTYGHDEGDEVLKGMVSMMQNRIRKNDVLARWGGEEFMILLSGMGLEDGIAFTGELLAGVRNLAFKLSGKITASFGVTQSRPDETPDLVLKRVDELVYKAKNEGRDCIKYSE